MRDLEARRNQPQHREIDSASAGGDTRARALHLRMLQRKAKRDGAAPNAEGAVEKAAQSSGKPLPEPLQQKFGQHLGADLSGVRVHTSGDSAEATEAVGARAYTTGNDIHFNAGEYDPESKAGQELIAHEVVHTQQQSRRGADLQRKAADGDGASDADETEANQVAKEATQEGAAKQPSGKGHSGKGHPGKGHPGKAGKKHPAKGQAQAAPKKDAPQQPDPEQIMALKLQAQSLLLDWQPAAEDKLSQFGDSIRDSWSIYLSKTASNPTVSPAAISGESFQGLFTEHFVNGIPAKLSEQTVEKFAHEMEESSVMGSKEAGDAGAARAAEETQKAAAETAKHAANEEANHAAAEYATEAGMESGEEGAVDGANLLVGGAEVEDAVVMGGEVGEAFGPEGALIGMAVAALVETVGSMIFKMFSGDDAEIQDALREAYAQGYADGSNAAGELIVAKSAQLADAQSKARHDQSKKIAGYMDQIQASNDPGPLLHLMGVIKAQQQADLDAYVPPPDRLASDLIDIWVRDHAKTDAKPDENVNEKQWQNASGGALRPDLFVDQCEKEWGERGLGPQPQLREQLSEFIKAEKMEFYSDGGEADRVEMKDHFQRIKQHFWLEVFRWPDTQIDNVKNSPNAHSYTVRCIPMLDVGEGGVYVDHFLYEADYQINDRQSQKTGTAKPGDDELVFDPLS